MLYSPDTDVYHIGLPIIKKNRAPEVYIYRATGCRKDSHWYLHLTKLLTEALHSDID